MSLRERTLMTVLQFLTDMEKIRRGERVYSISLEKQQEYYEQLHSSTGKCE